MRNRYEEAKVGLEIFYLADIHNKLLAAEQTVNATADAVGNPDDAFTAGFLTGYRATFTTLALAFGLTARPETSAAEWKPLFLAASLSTRPR